MKAIDKIWDAKDFIWSKMWTDIARWIDEYVSSFENGLFRKWIRAIYNYCMYTWDRVEKLVSRWYTKKDISKMNDYFHPMVYKIVNTMYGYLFDVNFTITANWGANCGDASKIQHQAERYWRQKGVFKNKFRIIKQAVLLGQSFGMPYVEKVFWEGTYTDKSKKKGKYVEDYVTAWLHKVSPFHLFYDPCVSREEQTEVSHCRNATWDTIKKELWFMTFDDWSTKLKKSSKINYMSMAEQKMVKKSGGRFTKYDFSKVWQVRWEDNFLGTTNDQLMSCLDGERYSMETWVEQYKIEKSNELHERTLCFRLVDCKWRLAVFINKQLVFEWESPYWNKLPYYVVYYKEPMEWSVERWLWVLLEWAQETANNSYRANNDAIRKNALTGSISVIEWNWTIKKNWKAIDGELLLEKDDVIHVGQDVRITNWPTKDVNQDYSFLAAQANDLGDYISNLNNVTWWSSSKITRVSGEVISKTQITQRELEPVVLSISDFVTCVTEFIICQINTTIKSKYRVFIWWKDVEYDNNSFLGRYDITWSTSRIDELYREINAQKKNAALELILQISPWLVNMEERAREVACAWWLDDKLILSAADAESVKLKAERWVWALKTKLLEDERDYYVERDKVFPPQQQPNGLENSMRTNVNINYKDITNPLVKQEILAEAWAESALQVDPITLLSVNNKEWLQEEVWLIETTSWVWVDGNNWVLALWGQEPQILDLAEPL